MLAIDIYRQLSISMADRWFKIDKIYYRGSFLEDYELYDSKGIQTAHNHHKSNPRIELFEYLQKNKDIMFCGIETFGVFLNKIDVRKTSTNSKHHPVEFLTTDPYKYIYRLKKFYDKQPIQITQHQPFFQFWNKSYHILVKDQIVCTIYEFPEQSCIPYIKHQKNSAHVSFHFYLLHLYVKSLFHKIVLKANTHHRYISMAKELVKHREAYNKKHNLLGNEKTHPLPELHKTPCSGDDRHDPFLVQRSILHDKLKNRKQVRKHYDPILKFIDPKKDREFREPKYPNISGNMVKDT